MRHLLLCYLLLSFVFIFSGCKDKAESIAVQPKVPAPAVVQVKPSEKPAESNKVKEGSQAFFAAALNGDIETVESELLDGVNPNAVNPDKQTAIMMAAFNGHTNIVELMITHGVKINHQDIRGRTALMFAASGPYEDTVKLLLEKGAEVNIRDSGEQWTALMMAAAEGQTEVVKVLLEYDADWRLKDIDGDTAESFAAQNGHAQVIKIIEGNAK